MQVSILPAPPSRESPAPVGNIYRLAFRDGERWCAVRSCASDGWLSNGFGDSIHATEQEARSAAESELARMLDEQARNLRRAAAIEQEESERREREDTDGFADQFSPLKRGRIIATLSVVQGYSGRFDTRRNHMRRFASLGFTPDTHESEGPIIRSPDDAMFYRVSATERDYLAFLLSR